MNDTPSDVPSGTPTAADVAARVAATIRADVRAMRAYAVAKAEGMIKLDAMENPYPLPARGAREARCGACGRRRSTAIRMAAPTR